jgi:Transposase DDE domain
VQLAESFGVELIAPVPGRAPHVDPQALTLDDFAHHEETGAVEACPASHAPLRVTRDEATHTTVVEMPATACASCPLLKLCPIRRTNDGRFELTFTDQARRLAARRIEQATPVFRERYAQRSGIESTNSGLKNRLGLGWLKVRGRGAVFRTLLLKVSGWNILRAASSAKLRALVRDLIAQLLKTGWSRPFGQAPRAILTHVYRSQQPHRPKKSQPTTFTRALTNSHRQPRFVV